MKDGGICLKDFLSETRKNLVIKAEKEYVVWMLNLQNKQLKFSTDLPNSYHYLHEWSNKRKPSCGTHFNMFKFL